MKLKSTIAIAFSNLFRRKLRSFLTILGVSIAIGVLFFLVNTAESIKKQIQDFTLKFTDGTVIQVSEKNDFSLLPTPSTPPSSASQSAKPKSKKVTDKTVAEIRKLANVKSAYPSIYPSDPSFIELTLVNKKESTLSAVSLNPTFIEDRKLLELTYRSKDKFITEGKFFDSNENDTIIPQEALVKKLKLKVGDNLQLKVETLPRDIDPEKPPTSRHLLGEITVKVVGIAKEPPLQQGEIRERPLGLMSYSVNKKIYDLSPIDPTIPKEFRPVKGEYFSTTVYVNNINNVKSVAKKIDKMGYSAITVFESLDAINTFFLVIQGILAAFSLVGLLISLIGISNTMFMSTLERTKEIGILKALGARDSDIYRIFLIESALFGLVGAIVGIFFASIMGNILAFVGNSYIQSQIHTVVGDSNSLGDVSVHYTVNISILGITTLFSILLSMIAGFLPARKASKLDPIKALKYE